MRLIRSFPMVAAAVLALSSVSPASAAMLAGVDALKEWNLIVFNNVSSSSEVEGRAFIGGDLNGNSSNYNTKVNTTANNAPGLTVVGNLNGGAKQVNNNVTASVGGNANAQINNASALNIGGTSVGQNGNQSNIHTGLGASFTNDLIAQKNLLVSSLNSLSDNLAALTNTGSTSIANNKLSITASGTGQNVFSLSLADFSTFGEIEVVNPNGATVVINVSGTTGALADNFVNTAADIGRNVVWNFYQATSLSFNNAFLGTVLATDAAVSNNNYIEGTLVANSFNQNGEVHLDTFQGNLNPGGVVSVAPEPSTWAMLILGFGLVGATMRRRGQRSLVLQAA